MDISWLAHNLKIALPRKKEVQHSAGELVSYVDEEIKSVKICNQCYENAHIYPDTSFVMPCNTPHLIIWAKPEGFPFWPAKAMTINDGKVHVRFFEDHTISDLEPENCYLFSEETPEDSIPSVETYGTALKVSIEYIF